MRGRKPTPWEMKVVHGTDRKDRRPNLPHKDYSGRSPGAPRYFDARERAEWSRTIRDLREEGRTLRPSERQALAGFVVLCIQIERARGELAVLERSMEEKAGSLGVSPEEGWARAKEETVGRRDRIRKSLRTMIAEMKSLAAELALTPSSRSRYGGNKGNDRPASGSPFAALSGGRK